MTQSSASPKASRQHDNDADTITDHDFNETSPLLTTVVSNQDAYTTITNDPVRDTETAAAFAESIQSQSTMTALKTEAGIMASSSVTMSITFFLQYSINFASIFAAGRIGKLELGAVALANMTVAVTCLAPFIGLATSLDTLCAQAFGDGRKHLVGLQCQRMTLLLFVLAIPVVIFWWNSLPIFEKFLGNPESARLVSLYLRVMSCSIPGSIIWESGKRMLQAQGLFRQTTYVLLIVAPLNLFVNWFLVFKMELGFIGAPIAVCFSRTMLAISLVLYIKFVNGYQCWGGFSERAFTNWWPMVWLALPGMLMILAEWGAFEIMTFLASRFGDDSLAAQSILITSSGISFQIPFAMSVASSSRVANLIGAGLVDRAKLATKVATLGFIIMGGVICTLYTSLRFYVPLIFTDDETVISIAARVMPIVGAMQVFDAIATGVNGFLRGIGKQSIGGPINVIAYYGISLPLSLVLGIHYGWNLAGFWTGITIALVFVAVVEGIFLLWVDWDGASEEARRRNMAN